MKKIILMAVFSQAACSRNSDAISNFMLSDFDDEKSQDPVDKKNPALTLEKVRVGLSISKPNINRAKNKHCVIIIGETGCGKSTLCNALYSGSNNLCEKKTKIASPFPREQINLVPKKSILINNSLVFGVGEGSESVTTHPEVAIKDGIAICDCPGFGDTRGGEQGLINCISIGEVLKNAYSVQICLLLTESTLTNKGGRTQYVKNMLHTASSIFKKTSNSPREQLEKFRNIRIIATNPTGNTRKTELQSIVYETLNDLTKRSYQDVIKQVANNLLLIDSADRPNKFVDSQVEDKVADLLTLLKAKNMTYSSNVFQSPVTKQVVHEISTICDYAKMLVLEALKENDYEQKVNPLLKSLNELAKYHNISPYIQPSITAINQIIEQKKEGIKNVKELKKTYEKQAEEQQCRINKLNDQLEANIERTSGGSCGCVMM